MLVTMSRQDLMGVVDLAKNRILERMLTKYDLNTATSRARDQILVDLQNMRKENQPVFRQTLINTEQNWRKLLALEARLVNMEQDLKNLTQLLNRVYGQQTRTTNSLQSAAFRY